MKQQKPKELKDSVKKMLGDLLGEEAAEPPPWQMQALKLAIGFLGVEAKLEEQEYGGFFGGPDPDGVPVEPRQELKARRRKRDTLSADIPGLDDGDPGGSAH